MNHYILHAGFNGKPAMLPWQNDLASRGIVALRAGRVEEIVHIMNAYDMVMVLIDITQPDPNLTETMQSLCAKIDDGHLCPMIGLHRDHLADADRTVLASAGFDDLVAQTDPERFILWKLETLVNLIELRQFQQTRLDVASLAGQTREQLHDLSQPLSAIQGRLQLLAAKCPDDDPNAECLKDLVRLIFEVSKQVTEIHHLHRQFS